MCGAQSTKKPAYIAYSLNLGFVLRSGTFGWRHSMCGTHFHITCKFPQNSPRNRSRAKVPDPIRQLKMAFYQVFLKILLGIRTPPGHSKFQSVVTNFKLVQKTNRKSTRNNPTQTFSRPRHTLNHSQINPKPIRKNTRTQLSSNKPVTKHHLYRK